MATIKTISDLAGVSPATVSNVLSGRSKAFRPAARERADNIRRIAGELGYRTDHAAQSLRLGRSSRIGLLGRVIASANIYNNEEIQIIGALASRLQEAGFSLAAELRTADEPIFTPPAWNIDAALLFVVSNPADLEAVEQARIPYVAFNGECGPSGSSVQFDDAAGMKLAIAALAERGHRRIAYLGSTKPGYRHRSIKIRRAAYARAMRAIAATPLPDRGVEAADGEGLEPPIAGMLRDQRPTAVVTYQPGDAVVLYRVAASMGLEIPRDLSVISFNESDVGRDILRPALTAIARPIESTAQALATQLLGRLNEPEAPPQSTRLTPQLLVRGSIAALSPA